MKELAVIACLLAGTLQPALALGPLELIQGVGSDLIEDYAAPLAQSYGVAMGSGLYHSAKAHKFLGFDIGVRFMLIRVPASGKTFAAPVKYCYFDTSRMDTVWKDTVIQGAATIFGPRGLDGSWVPQGGVGIPPGLPGGLGVDYMPFLLPQASLGLPIPGSELLVRYVPWPFQGTTVNLLGLGLKEELTALPGLKKLPFNFAIQGFYQTLSIGSAMSSTSYGGNVHISKGILIVTPYAGVGFDKTTMRFDYTFNYQLPTGYNPETHEVTYTSGTLPVKLNYAPGMNIRGTVGATVKLGLLNINADYSRNFSTGYDALTAGLAIGFR